MERKAAYTLAFIGGWFTGIFIQYIGAVINVILFSKISQIEFTKDDFLVC